MDRRERYLDQEEDTRMALDSAAASLWVALPAIVESVDFTAMTITAQPALTGMQNAPDGSTSSVKMPLLVDVPIMFQGGGGYSITLPIAKGDECLIIFADRCIDAWWQSGGVQAPMESRMHDLSDGFALVGVRSQPKVVPSISQTKVQIRSDDGTVFVEIDKTGKVNITAPTSVTVTSPITTFTGNIKVNGTATIDGASTLTGAVSAGSTITASGEITGNSIALSTHTHPQAPDSFGNTEQNTGAPL